MGGGLAGGGRAVMTSCTGTWGHPGMAEGGWLPGGGAMAGVASLRGRNMGGGLAGGGRAVMTSCTGTWGHPGMAEGGWLPGGGAMAGVASG
jgi:hypothetical protein